jgi:hypothetical protein
LERTDRQPAQAATASHQSFLNRDASRVKLWLLVYSNWNLAVSAHRPRVQVCIFALNG